MEVNFECNATGIPAPEIQFFLGNSLLDSNFNERFSLLDPTMETIDISDSGSGELVYLVTRQLSINNTLDADSNNYSCVASNANVRQPVDSVEFELVVRGKYKSNLHTCIAERLKLITECSSLQ